LITYRLQEPDQPDQVGSVGPTQLCIPQDELETSMVDPARRARILRDLLQDFIPDYAQRLPIGRQAGGFKPLAHVAFPAAAHRAKSRKRHRRA
jgi:hypothetical protein